MNGPPKPDSSVGWPQPASSAVLRASSAKMEPESSELAPQPENVRVWRSLLLLAPFQFMFGLVYSWGVMEPVVHAQAGWSYAGLDWTFSLTPLALFPSAIWAGHQLQQMTPKGMLAIALVLFSCGCGLALASGSPNLFMLGYSVLALGIGAGLSTTACIAVVSRLHPNRRGTLGGALLALYGVSSAVSAPLFSVLDAQLGWRARCGVMPLALTRIDKALYGLVAANTLDVFPTAIARDVNFSNESREAARTRRRCTWIGTVVLDGWPNNPFM